MADENLIEIVIRATTGETRAQIGAVNNALRGLGEMARTTSGGVGALGENLAASAVKFGVLGAAMAASYEALNVFREGIDALKDGLVGVVNTIEQYRERANGIAAIATTFSKTQTLETFNQNLKYANSILMDLDLTAVRFNATGQDMQRVFQGFASQGIFAKTQAEVNAIGAITDAINMTTIGENKRIEQLAQVRELLSGNIRSTSIIAKIIEKQVGDTNDALRKWINLHEKQGDAIVAIGDKMRGFLLQQENVQTLTSTWSNTLQTIYMRLSLIAGGGLFEGVVRGLREVATSLLDSDGHLTRQAEILTERLAPGFKKLGQTVESMASMISQHWDSIGTAINTAMGFLNGFLGVMKTLEGVVLKVLDAWQWVTSHPSPFANIGADYRARGISTSASSYGGGGGSSGAPSWLTNLFAGLNRGGNALYGEAAPPPSSYIGTAEHAEQEGGAGMASSSKVSQPSDTSGAAGAGAGGKGHTKSAHQLAAEAYQRATTAIAEETAHLEVLANAIDDTAQRSARLAAIHEQEALAYQHLAATTKDATLAARARLKAEELLATAAQESRQADQQAIQEHVQASEAWVAMMKERGQLGAAEEIAAYQRVLDWLETQHGPAAEKALQAVNTKLIALHRQQAQAEAKAAKDGLDLQLKAVQDHMADLDAAGQLTLQVKVGLLNQEIALVQQAEAQQILTVREAQDQITTLVRERVAAVTQAERQQAQTVKSLAHDMTSTYTTEFGKLMQPITNAVNGVTKSLESGLQKALEGAVTGFGKRGGLLEILRGIGQSVLSEITGFISKGIVSRLNLEPLLARLFGPLNKFAGGVGSPADAAQQAAQAALQHAADTQHVSSQVFAKAVAAFQEAVSHLTAAKGGVPGALSGLGRSTGGVVTAGGQVLNTGDTFESLARGEGVQGWINQAVRGSSSIISLLTGLPGIGSTFGGLPSSAGEGGGGGGGGSVGGWLGQAFGFISKLAGLFHFAEGGLVPGHLFPLAHAASGAVFGSPTLALVGEGGGPEAVVPLRNGKIPVDLGGGGGQTTIAIYAWDTVTGMDQLYQHRDFLGQLLQEQHAANAPVSKGPR